MSHPDENPAAARTAHTTRAPGHAPAAATQRGRLVEPGHSGEGRLVTNLIAFSIMFVLFAAAVYTLGFFERTNVLPFGISLVLAFLAFWIPQTILGRSDTGGQMAHGERPEQ